MEKNETMAVTFKNWLRMIHGAIYLAFLPALVRPPAARNNGTVQTIVRINISRFLESWVDQVHGEMLDVGAGTNPYARKLFSNRCNYVATDCFEHPNIDVVSDIHSLSSHFAPESFDFIICTDVLEHIARPWIAIQELHKVLKPGGILILTTPFNFHLHGNRKVEDYWRISAAGLRELLQNESTFDQVEVEACGHPEFPFSHTVVARKGTSIQ